MLRQNWFFGVLLLAGAALRLIVMLAYEPALIYIDSFRYLYNLRDLDPTQLNPIGYQLFLLKPALFVTKSLQLVVLLQHFLGLALAVGIYLLLVRRAAPRWVAALATGPVLLDAYQVQIEHNIMSDLLFELLLLAVVMLLLWQGAPRAPVAAFAGLLLAAAVITRTVAVPLIVPAAVYVLCAVRRRDTDERRTVLRRFGACAALVGCFGVGLFGYASYFHSFAGSFGLTGANAKVLYGRTATVADCTQLKLNPAEIPLCPKEPLGQREGVDVYAHGLKGWDPKALELAPQYGGLGKTTTSFAYKVLAAQPWDVAQAVVKDIFKSFSLTRTTLPGDVPVERWQFQLEYPRWPGIQPEQAIGDFGGPPIKVDTELAAALRKYQLTIGYTPGVLLGGLLLISIAGMLGIGRARRSGLRSACLLTAGLGSALIVTSAAFEFSWRYQLPTLVLIPIAGALGWTALTRKHTSDDEPPQQDAAPAGSGPPDPDGETGTMALPPTDQPANDQMMPGR